MALLAASAAAARPAPPAHPAVAEGEASSFGDSAEAGFVKAPLMPGARFTPLDLIKRYFTDLTDRGEYRTVMPIRAVDDATDFAFEHGLKSETALSLPSPTHVVVHSGRFAYGFVLAGGVLIGDRLAPVPGVTDALYVRTDPGGEPSVEYGFMIGPETPAAVVYSAHHNAGEEFQSYRIVVQRNGRLHIAYSGPELYTTTIPEGACEARRHMQKLTSIRPLASRHYGYADIAAVVTETAECASDGRDDTVERRFPFVLRWDTRIDGYRGGSPTLDRLNRRRMGMEP